ncbi:PAS domain S-box protein [Pontibacter sp. Tf4]|uniref:PAS domain-containing sensor histidine kinase n=1 Tax=Pontibacter sp. Tf4 TaxID=2761620 RepID=UPI001627692F|nr:PAS domain S-box protein [Pontibacter sp. Tf4]MBB6611701.1 PAS domain S-box protein [Pontibacter sp. Tf4]
MSKTFTPEFYDSILKNSHDKITIIDHEGLYMYVSDSVEQQLNYTSEELIGGSALHHIHNEDLPHVFAALKEIQNTRQLRVKPFRYLHKNGSWRWLDCVLTNMLDNPAVKGYVTNSRDITEEIESEKKREKSQAYYKALFINHPDLVFTLNEEGVIEESNASVSKVTSFGTEESIGKHFAQFIAPAYLEEALQAFRKVIKGGAHAFETVIIDKNGEKIDLSVTLVPVWLDNRITAVHCIAKDITQIKQSERLLKEQTTQLNNILGSITEAFFAVNRQWCITYANKAFADYFQVADHAVLHTNIWQEYPDLVHSVFYRKCMEVMATGIAVEHEEYIVPLQAVTNYKIYPFEEGIAVCFTDITAKKAAQEELKKLSLVASKTTNGVIITDNKGRIEWANNSFLKLTGYVLDEVLQQDPVMILQGPETNQEALQNMKRLLCLGIPFSEELLTYKKNGEKVWIASDVTPILDEAGEIEKYVIIYTDISDRKYAETKLLHLNENLVQQNRDLQQFTYIVSHNLRAPVANIVGLTRMLPKLQSDAVAFTKALANLDKSVQRLDAVICDLGKILAVKTPDSSEVLEPVDLATLSAEVAQSLQETTTAIKATVILKTQGGIVLQAKRAYLYSILHNLFTNAIKYRSEERPLQLQLTISKNSDGSTAIQVTDNGLGMDMDAIRPHIFKLYNRFHVHTEGRGLGLYLVKSQVEAMGGTIEVESVKGEGTTFKIHFKAQRND